MRVEYEGNEEALRQRMRCLREAVSKENVGGEMSIQAGPVLKRAYAGALATGLLGAGLASAASNNFYANRKIDFIIGSGEGGGYDLYARLLAQHMSKYIPGNPTIVPQNMPGDSGILAAEYVYNAAPKDGTVVAMFQSTFVLDKIVDPTLRYQPEHFAWLGRINSMTAVGGVWASSPVHSLEDAKKQTVTMAAIGPTGTAATIPWALNRTTGTKFKVVLGYTSSATAALAMEQGEADGNGSTSWDYVETKPDWTVGKKFDFLYAIDLARLPAEPQVPTVEQQIPQRRDREAMKLVTSTSTIGRSVVSTPGMPADRAQILRTAFEQTVKDPSFIADAEKLHFDVAAISGENMQTIVKQVAGESPDIVARMGELTKKPQ
jgi:tripartite-type tricarboxylate transporter receptor subunit TctC